MIPVEIFFNATHKNVELDITRDMLAIISYNQPFEFTLSPTKSISVTLWPVPLRHSYEFDKLTDDQELMLQTILDDMKERYEKARN